MSESGEGSGKAASSTGSSSGAVPSNASGSNVSGKSGGAEVTGGRSQSGSESAGSEQRSFGSGAQMTVKLASFNKYGDTGEHSAVYQPDNPGAGVRLVKGMKFSARQQQISRSQWDEGLEATDEANAEAEQVINRKRGK